MMEVGARALILKNLSSDEYDKIDVSLREKIEAVLNEHIEDYITAKALLESTRGIQQEKVKEAQDKWKTATQERDEFKIKADALLTQFEESSKRLSSANLQLNKLREDVTRCQKELEEVRRERDVAVDERQVTSSTLERREAEIERLSGEVTSLSQQLRSAIQAKCEAIAEADEAKAKQMEIDFKEKRFEAEISLMRKQVADLTSDLSKATEDMSKQRRDSTTQVIMLQTKVAEKEEELRIEKEQNMKLQAANQELTDRIEELTKKLKEQTDKEDKLVENFQQEVKAQTKLADLYKERLEDCESRAAELSTAVRELQQLLAEASTQYGDLETKLKAMEADHKEAMEAKQETLSALKEELAHANILLEAVKQESSEAAVSRLSPMAASASKLMKSGLTLTQLYTKYAESTQELLILKQENNRLKEYTERIVKEIEEKAPILQKQREDYQYAISTMELLNVKVDELENEVTKLQTARQEAQETAEFQIRENRRLNGCCGDLSRQVCFLLRELEAARGNTIPLHDDREYTAADAKTSSEVISKHLVTFRDIEELQLTNLKLRAALRELSAEKEEVETERESVNVKSLKGDIRRAESKIEELNEREKILQKQISAIKSQRDAYARLYKQHVKPGTPIDIDAIEEGESQTNGIASPAKPGTPPGKTPPKKEDNDKELDTVKQILEEMKKEHTIYREERRENEKLMGETIDRLRTELSEAMGKKSELASKAEHYSEIIKTLQGRVQKLTEENSAMGKRCTAYLSTISKHEITIQQMRKEAMDAMSNVTIAEQKILNLQQEVQLLKDSERRLMREREAERKMKHGQELLMSNLESLKAKFESAETETRMRLESQLEKAHSECSDLRRRLQEEQDRLGRRVELAEEQAKTAKVRLEEARAETARLQKELEATQEEVKERESRLESMSSELTSAITKSQPILDRENRIKELEGALREREADVNGLNEQLTAAKRTIKDLSEVSQSIEKQLAEVTEQYEEYKKESEKIIENYKKTEAELKCAAAQMEMKLKTSSAAEAEMRAEREAELASLRSRCEGLSKSLEEAKTRVSEAEASATAAEAAAKEQAERVATEATKASQLIQDLETVKNELSDLKGKLSNLEAEKERSIEGLVSEKNSMLEKISALESALSESESKIAELSKVNDILHDQMQELGLKVSVLDASSTSLDQSTSANESLLTSEAFRESDKMLEVMRHLRKEKMSALAQADSLRGEKTRLEADVEVLRRQLEEAKINLEAERNSMDTPSITAERHTQLLAKVETLNQLTENNRQLMEERDKLSEKLRIAETEVSRLEKEVVEPAKREAAESSAKAEQYSIEATALRAESQRWQERANQLIEKTNKNPDELKRLTLEKENLTKQLGIEKEQARVARVKLEDRVANLEKEKEDVKTNLEKAMEGLKQELNTSKEASTKTAEELSKLQSEFAVQQEALNDLRNKERQIRLIAKRYKQQYTDTLKLMEDERKSREDAGPSISPETEEKIKHLADQVSTHESEIENLKRENENIKVSSNERDERAKQILKNARAKIMLLTEDKKKLEDILSKGGEGDLRQIISQLEKEKEEEIAEKERLQRELEVMSQRLAIMQRQLDKQQQGSKPSTSSVEKGTADPPTANIKPMAGPSTSGVKQAQAQHAATVTPWRETPFASIRPMAPQTRTVVVLPSTQSTSSQPILVAPQQQVVHTSSTCEGLSSSPTSSHTDYMPATSSAVHNIHPTAVLMGQHMEAETVSEEGPSQLSVQPTQNNVTIALVEPLPLKQPVVEESGQLVASSATSGVGSGSSNQQAASSTTSTRQGGQGGSKRPATTPADDQGKHSVPVKRTRLTPASASASTPTNEGEMLLRSDGLEVEYQVPTSSQRDQEDDILVISDEEDDMPDDGGMEDGQEFEEEVEEEGRYSLEGYSRDAQEIAGYEESEGPDIDEGSTTDQDNNEVDIDDSSEVPVNRCESTRNTVSETVASGGEATSSLSSVSSNQAYPRRPTAVPILNRHILLPTYEDGGDDSIVPSTPTLFVPRRGDGFGEAVSSPQVPTAGRFTFSQESTPPLRPAVLTGVAQAASEGMDDTRMDLSTLEEGTGRSVPSTPSHVSPQEAGGDEIGQSTGQETSGSSVMEGAEPESDQQAPVDDNPDGVSSEGEKASGSRVSQDEEEGREAEASPARRAASRRSPRSTRARRVTPIVWEPSTASMLPVRGNISGRAVRGQTGRGGPFRGGRPRRTRPPYPGNQPFQPNRF